MNHPNRLISIVIPVFNEQDVLPLLVGRLEKVAHGLGSRYEILFIDDGSTDLTPQILKQEKEKNPHIRVITFSRNFGHQIAITAGFDLAKGDAVIIMDADLQDPPEVIPELILKWQSGYDIVDAKRERRMGESFFKKWTAAFYYRLLKKISNAEVALDVGDFRLLSRRAVDALNRLRESRRFLRGMISWLGFPRASVAYVRENRRAGNSKYPLGKMLRFSLDGIIGFSIAPLRFATWIGFGIACLSFLYLPYAAYVRFVLNDAVRGWTTLIIAVFFLGGIQLICLGIIGEYIGVLLEESKKRPLYLIRDDD